MVVIVTLENARTPSQAISLRLLGTPAAQEWQYHGDSVYGVSGGALGRTIPIAHIAQRVSTTEERCICLESLLTSERHRSVCPEQATHLIEYFLDGILLVTIAQPLSRLWKAQGALKRVHSEQTILPGGSGGIPRFEDQRADRSHVPP